MTSPPFVKFHQLYPDAPVPKRADATLGGAAFLRAYTHCEPFAAGSSFGWYVFPPVDFSLMWDGSVVSWKVSATDPWQVLDDAVALPGFGKQYVQKAPQKLRQLGALPFLGRGPEPGIVQIFAGLLIETPKDWSVLIRPLANYPRDARYEVLDGIIETGWWQGPVITPLRIVKTDEPIRFQREKPLYQIQPVPRRAYAEDTLSAVSVTQGLEDLAAEDWQRLEEAMTLRHGEKGKAGSYKREVRRRSKPCPRGA